MKWIAAALLLLLLGAIFQLGLLVYAMYVLLAVLLASRFLARSWIDKLEAEREWLNDAAEIGGEVEVSVTLRNKGRFTVPWLIIEDSLPINALTQNPPRLRATGSRIKLTRIRPGAEERLSYHVRFLSRGYYQIGPLLIESGDLFGLHRRFRVVTQPHFVLVLPKIVPLEGYDLVSRQPVGEVRMTHRLFEDPTRISGVRPYETGDPLNRIHWRVSAHTGVLHSKSYEPSSVAGATFLLDLHRDSYHGHAPAHRLELAVTAVASLANALDQLGQRVGLITNGRDAADRIREEGWDHEFRTRKIAQSKLGMRNENDRLRPVILNTRRGPDQLTRILEILARLELTDGLTFAELILEAGSQMPRNATVVAVLTEVSPETALALVQLHRRGYAVTVVLAVFDQPQTPDWAQRPDWAGWLLNAGIEVRRVENETALSSLCAEQLIR